MICKTCGLELNEGAKFCPGCGQPVELEEQTAAEEVTEATEAVEEPAEESAVPAAEEQPKKKKWLLPVILGAVAVAAVLAAVLLLGGTGGVSLEEFQNELNYINGTGVVFDESRLYFVGKYREDDEHDSVFSTDYNGGNKTLISSDGDIVRLRCIKGKLYFEASRENPDRYEVGILDKETGVQTVVFEKDELVYNFHEYQGKVYYATDSEMRCCSLDGGDDQLLFSNEDSFENGDSFVICDGIIYYSSETAVYAYDIDTGDSRELCGGADPVGLSVFGKTLYFGAEDGLYAFDLKDEQVKTIVREEVDRNYTFYDNRFFFIREFTEEYRDDLAIALAEGNSNQLLTYNLLLIGVGNIYSVDAEGKEKPVRIGSESDISYSLYATPNGLYEQNTFVGDPELLEYEQ